MSDTPLATCPSCGCDALRRLVGPGAGLIFKGEGFYATDYKKPVVPPGKESNEKT